MGVYTITGQRALLTVEIPPATTLAVEELKMINNSICVNSKTLFILTAEDESGSGIAGISYRVYNATYDTGEKPYTQPFNITGLSDGKYIVDYFSMNKAGTTEPTNNVAILLDDCPPIIESPTREPAGDVQPDHPVKILVAITDNTTQVRNATLSYTTNSGSARAPNLTLVNTTIQNWSFMLTGSSNATFSNSSLRNVDCKDSATATIRGGPLWLLQSGGAFGNGVLYAYDTGASVKFYSGDAGTVWLTNSSAPTIELSSEGKVFIARATCYNVYSFPIFVVWTFLQLSANSF